MLQTMLQKLKNTKKIYLAVIAVVIVITSGAGVAIATPGLFSFSPASQAQSTATANASPDASPSSEATSETKPSDEPTQEPSKEASAPAPAPAPAAAPVVTAPVPAPAVPPAAAAPVAAPAVPLAPVAPAPAAPAASPVPAPAAPPAAPAPVVSEYAQLVQNIVAPWCGTVRVLVDDLSVVSGDIYGMSWWGTNKIGIRSGMPMAITKDMALHECGHILQARVFPNKQEAVNRMNAIHGTSYGIETNARCISAYLHPNAAPAGVGSGATARWHSGECAGVAGDAAIKIVQGIRP